MDIYAVEDEQQVRLAVGRTWLHSTVTDEAAAPIIAGLVQRGFRKTDIGPAIRRKTSYELQLSSGASAVCRTDVH